MKRIIKLTFEKTIADYQPLNINSRGGSLTKKKEYFVWKILVVGVEEFTTLIH